VRRVCRPACLPQQMQHHLPLVRPAAMLEQIDTLPGAERRLAIDDRDGQLHLRQRRAQMRRHVIGPFVVVCIARGIFGRELLEKGLQIGPHLPGRVLLDQQRRRGVPAEYGEQPGSQRLTGHPTADLPGDLDQSPAGGANGKDVGALAHGGPQALARPVFRVETLAPTALRQNVTMASTSS
jgi:hypothetical protein